MSNTRVRARVEVLAAQSSRGVGLLPITATRVLDTRTTGRLQPGVQVQVPSVPGLPADTQALTVSVTLLNPDAAGTFSMGFCGQGPWTTASSGEAMSSFSMTMRTSASGWCLSSSVATDVVLDVTGAWAGSALVATVDPSRVFDSRSSGATGSVGQAGTPVQIAGVGGVPAGAATAVVALTAVTGASATSLFAYPCAEGHLSGTVVAALPNRVSTVLVPVRLSAGQLCVKSIQPADVIIDVVAAG
jgi:hypothetical protein